MSRLQNSLSNSKKHKAQVKVKKKSTHDSTLLPFDKYKLYSDAVQSPETDVIFYQERYSEIFNIKVSQLKKNALVLREDFCAAGAISCEWVKLSAHYKSCGLDLDPEPMDYGRQNYISKLSVSQKSRVALIEKNVLEEGLPKAHLTCAVNFSYFIFKDRKTLTNYFKNVYQSLHHQGLFIVDVFGGTQCTDAITDKTQKKNFTYYWEQKGFDPVKNEAQFGIHFKFKNKMYKNVFTYDWRLWTIPELKEMMVEAGFDETFVYWEGTNSKGSGNGIFTRVTEGESCLSWISYLVAVKK